MNPQKSNQIAGLLYGSLVGDSLALGAHWIYDQEKLRNDFGRVSDFLDPLPDSYHPRKKRGEQTHCGDQALTLLTSIQENGGYFPAKFASAWKQMWTAYPDYLDHATKETLQKIAAGVPEMDAASDSDELAGPARIAPLLAALANGPLEEAVAAARNQTALTHGSPISGDTAEWLARLVFAQLENAEIPEALERAAKGSYVALDLVEMGRRVAATRSLSLLDAAKSLGLACPIPQAVPTVLMLLDRCGDDLENALIENVMVGGDQAARGLALGMILGARFGKSGIPERWTSSLIAAGKIESILQREVLC